MVLPYAAETAGFWTMDLKGVYMLTHHDPHALAVTLGFDVVSTLTQSTLGSAWFLSGYDRVQSHGELEGIAKKTGADRIYTVSGVDREYALGLWAKSMKSSSIYVVEASADAATSLRTQHAQWTEVDPRKAKVKITMTLAGFDDVLPTAELELEDFLQGKPLPADTAKVWKDAADQWSRRLPAWNRGFWLNTWDKTKIRAALVENENSAPIEIGDLLKGREVGMFLRRDPKAVALGWLKAGWAKARGTQDPDPTGKVGGRMAKVIKKQNCDGGIRRTLRALLGRSVAIGSDGLE